MGFAAKAELINREDGKEKPAAKWTMRQLLPAKMKMKNIAKVFLNPLEVALGFNILVFGISVLLGREVPLGFYFLTFPFIIAVAYERFFLQECAKCDIKKEEPKKPVV